MTTNRRRGHHRPRLLAVLAGVLVAGAALSACGGSGRSTTGPTIAPFGRAATAGGVPAPPSPTASAGPWVSACDVLSDNDAVAAASGYGTTITVTGHKAEETQSPSGDRISTCRYAMTAAKGNESVSGGGIVLRVSENAAYVYFPLRAGYERVGGVGDEAAWNLADPPSLLVRVGQRLYEFSGPPPWMDLTDAQFKQMDRDVLVKAAKSALAKV
jgi:hypothetical protein